MLIFPAIDLKDGRVVRLTKGDYGRRFHPEKSGQVGLNILRAFAEWKGEAAC